MKKAFRDIKRGVNKKVLKVPSIEQKVLDATSNESWGPHGTHLADIAQASRNYHEYQIIMSVVWKRLSDTGKNWRHVYKALTVLEYLVANGSERVIEDIREHGYQISNLASFQYIDSTGRDQGSNVRKKSQSLVALVNDKEKIQEAREKAAASRDKFRQTSGGSGDDRYDGQYGSRDEDRNGYGRDSYGRDGEDRYSYADDEYRRKSQSIDGDYGAKSQSSDRDDGHHSSRDSNARVEDASPDGSRLEPKFSGQNLVGPPSYENAVTEGEAPPPPPAANTLGAVLASNSEPPVAATPPPPAAATPSVISDKEPDGFDFFDPRGPPPAVAAPSASSNAEVDLFGSLSDSFSSDVLALVPSEPPAPTSSNPSQTFVAASPTTQFDDPFGDGPFRAVPSSDGFSAQQSTSPFTVAATDVFSAQQSKSPFTEPPQTVAQTTVNDMGFGDGFDQSVDILAGFPNSNGQSSQPNNNLYGGFQPQGQPTSAPTPPAASVSSFYQQPQLQSNTSKATQPPSVTASTGALAIVPQQPAKEKFETKSTVWTDTLNRGLVNLNIDGSKTNPLSDIGIDFEAINRKEKRMEKPSKTPATSNVTMGKAMGSGSGIGRAGAGALRPASNPMAGSAMGMGMGAGQGFGGGYGGLNQPMGMNHMPQNMGMGMNNMPQNMGMGMNNMPQNMGLGMNNGQGFQMQAPPAAGFMPPGNYNRMMGRGGGYGQQPYGGYR
ncbi:putative ENTH domain-containing protein [Helianthus debilis subsp. tardiflorus]